MCYIFVFVVHQWTTVSFSNQGYVEQTLLIKTQTMFNIRLCSTLFKDTPSKIVHVMATLINPFESIQTSEPASGWLTECSDLSETCAL